MSYDAIVVGGGVIGLSIAWKSAQRGLRTALVADPGRTEASKSAVGGLSFCLTDAVLNGDEAVIELSVAARSSYGQFISSLEDASGVDTLFRRQATLLVRCDGDESAVLDRVVEARAAIGLSSTRLTAAECLRQEPRLSGAVIEGLLLEEHDQIDSRALTHALWEACARSGVHLQSGAVSKLLVGAERAEGVELASGERMLAETVVVAAGAWAGSLGGLPAELVGSVRPVAGQVLVVRAPSGLQLPAHDLRNARVYIVTRSDGTVLVGSTKEERDFDDRPTAGSVQFLLTQAALLWADIGQCAWVSTSAGLRPKSADGLPLVGRTSVPGVHVASGHYKNGIMFAAETADAVVASLMNEPVAPLFGAFSPDRLIAR